MNVEKCEHLDRGFSKYKDLCTKVHQNEDSQGPCEDKRMCKKTHIIICKNGSTCKWQSCEILYRKDEPQTELAKIKAFEKIVLDKIEVFDAMVNRYMNSILKIIIMVDQDLDAIKELGTLLKKSFHLNLKKTKRLAIKS